MAQVCDGFSKTSLMGNWYEQRLANQQKCRDEPDNKTSRQVEEAISFPTNQGELKPLSRIQRQQPWDTNGIVVDDGFKDLRSEFQTKYDRQNLDNFFNEKNYKTYVKQTTQKLKYPECNQYNIQLQEHQKPSQLNTENIHEVTQNKRDVKLNRTDFGSTFRRHDDDKNRFYGLTTYNKQLGQTTKESHFFKYNNNNNKYAGYNDRPLTQQGMKMTSVLTGEKYKNDIDPKDNTAVQRSWLPFQDKSLCNANRNLENNKMKNLAAGIQVRDQLQTYRKNNDQVKQSDIATSLPLGDGVHSLQQKYADPGQFRKIRTDVTLVRNLPLIKR